MNYLNKDQMTNKEYCKKKNEELFEIELQKLDGIYFDFSKQKKKATYISWRLLFQIEKYNDAEYLKMMNTNINMVL